MICTFYSYKGGVGRSMALANVADVLARRGLKVMIIDFDLEAPGIERFFLPDPTPARRGPGLLDLLIAYKQGMSAPVMTTGDGHDFRRLDTFLVPIYHQLPSGGILHLLPAGQRGDDEQLSAYAYHLRTFDWQEFIFEWSGEMFFSWLRRELLKRYDLVLVDSRTGVTEMGGVCAYQLADAIVMFCAANSQNVQGTRDIIRNFQSPRVRALRKDRGLEVIVVPARVQQNSPEVERFRREFEKSFEAYAPQGLTESGQSMWELMIPYDGRYAFEERLVTTSTDQGSDLKTALERLADVLSLIAPAVGKLRSAARRAERDGARSLVNREPDREPVYDPTKPFAGYDVFFSYHSSDRFAAEKIARRLQDRKLRVWLDTWEIVPGENFVLALERALEQSRTIVVLIGPASAGGWQDLEMQSLLLGAAEGPEKKRIIPVLLPGSSPGSMPALLRPRMSVDFRSSVDDEEALDALASGIRDLPLVPRPSPTGDLGTAPYKGLAPFEEEDARLFFGREAETDAVVALLRSVNFAAVVGSSGSGKTSLVFAGVLPRLRSEMADLKVVPMQPGHDPFRSLATALTSVGALDSPAAQEVQRRTDVDLQRLLPVHVGGPVLLVIDQLEQIWRLPDSGERSAFLRSITSAVASEVKVLVVLRADFYGEAVADETLRYLIAANQIPLGALSREGLRAAIENPAKLFGLALEPGLAEALIADCESSPATLPLLQFVLLRMFEDRKHGFLTHEAYAAVGAIGGALSMWAERTFTALSADQQTIARSVLLRLVTGSGVLTSYRMESFGPEEREVVEAFSRASLVAIEQAGGTAVATLAHEAVVRNWRRLDAWIEERREALLARDQIARAAAEWDLSGRTSDALYRGILLARGEAFRRTEPDIFAPNEVAFLRASAAHARRTRLLKTLAAAAFAASWLLVFWLWFARGR